MTNLIQHPALAMIAGLTKLDRLFYERDIEAVIVEAERLGEILYQAGVLDGRLTEQEKEAARAAFNNETLKVKDREWLMLYDMARNSGDQPDAGTANEAWWD